MLRTRKTDLKARHKRLRKKVTGTEQRPRLAVFRSSRHIYAQIINDNASQTLISASTLETDFKQKMSTTGNIAAAKLVGEILGKRAIEKGIKKVIFDRGGFHYHGRIKALADAVRQSGLEF